jgi:hypothetical protein
VAGYCEHGNEPTKYGKGKAIPVTGRGGRRVVRRRASHII